MELKASIKCQGILNRIGEIKPFIQASFSITKKRCGNPACRCAKEGPIHESALLTWKEGKRTCTLYVPKELREAVKKCVEEWKLLRQLITEMSSAQREALLGTRKSEKNKKP
jgi:hypothetical protein